MFSGNTEWQLLASIEEIVEESLPNKKLADHFQDPEAAKLCILNKIAFCETTQGAIMSSLFCCDLLYSNSLI